MLAHLDEDVFAVTAVLAVEIDDGVTGGAGAGEEVEDGSIWHPCTTYKNGVLYRMN